MLTRMTAYWVARGARVRLKHFRSRLRQCRSVQHQLLLRILRANAASDFGREYGFSRIRSYPDFLQALPLANYSRFAPYIDRCRRGENHALFGPGQRILQFALTSGTTARAKYIPVTEAFLQGYRHGWDIWGVKALSDHPRGYLRKILQVSSPGDESRTEMGVPCGAISGLLAERQSRIVRRFYVLPPETAHISAAAARYYAIMRFAMPEDIGFISTANPSTVLKLARTGAENAARLVQDIHDGTLWPELEIAPELRTRLKRRLRPNVKAAARLGKLLERHGSLLPMHYWNLAFLANWTGGTLSLYLPHLGQYFGNVPIRDIGLLASEGRLTVPFEDNTPAGVLDVTSNFYEFVPQEEYEAVGDVDARDTLDFDFTVYQAAQLERGCCYYVFLTNYAGLYRYNLGDLVRVTDHIDGTPVIEFLSKGAHGSSITGEKLTEKQVVDAVHTAADELAIAFESFIMVPEWGDPPAYRLYLESTAIIPRRNLDQFAARIEQRLTTANLEYDSKRASERLGPLQVRQVPVGFLARRDLALMQENCGRQEQFKHRFLYNRPLDLD